MYVRCLVKHKRDKEKARDKLMMILSSVRFLARQGLAFRKVDDLESNLVQLLLLRGNDNENITAWLQKGQRKYISPENQNEMLQIMADHVTRNILSGIYSSPMFTLMVDETTDVANKEQLTIVIRWINANFEANEDFLGLYSLADIRADGIVAAIRDVFLRYQIPFAKLRGQCYDGCSTMAGSRGGVAVKIQEIQPKAVFTHCYGHALNLGVGDVIKCADIMRDCLDT